MMTVKEQRAAGLRSLVLTLAILLLFVGMGGRYFHLMVLRHGEFRELASSQLNSTREVRGIRGSILDRRGRALALSRTLDSVAVDPMRVAPEDRARVARQLAAALRVEPAFVLEQLEKKSRFRWLRRFVRDPAVVARLPLLDPEYTILRKELGRSYPAGAAGAHLLGYSGIDGTGLAGAEFTFDAALRARAGQKQVMRDGKAGAVSLPEELAAGALLSEDGEDVLLAMDLTIQSFVDEALAAACAEWEPESAVAVVLDPRNGDVLAMASLPGYDPGDFPRAPESARRNRVVADVFEPGSTMKPLVAAAALDRGVVSFTERFDCTEDGHWRIGRRTIHDHQPMGMLSFAGVVVHSSNIGMAKIGLRLGVEETYRHIHALGFGAKTGVGLPGEACGLVRDRADWTEVYTLPSVSMGHEIAVTPLQFAAAFASLANGGVLYRPRLAIRVGGEETPPQPLRQVFSPEVVRRFMAPALVQAVTEGTGTRARIPGYGVAGKTGTAQVLGAGGATVGYVSSFVAFAPADDPQFLVLVLLHKPRRDRGTPYGGTVAAPAVKRILEQCLGYAEVPPRDDVEETGRRGDPGRDEVEVRPANQPGGEWDEVGRDEVEGCLAVWSGSGRDEVEGRRSAGAGSDRDEVEGGGAVGAPRLTARGSVSEGRKSASDLDQHLCGVRATATSR